MSTRNRRWPRRLIYKDIRLRQNVAIEMNFWYNGTSYERISAIADVPVYGGSRRISISNDIYLETRRRRLPPQSPVDGASSFVNFLDMKTIPKLSADSALGDVPGDAQ